MAQANWDRQYRFIATATDEDGNLVGFEVGDKSETGEAIHIQFDIQRSDEATLNETKIHIWNLTREHINILQNLSCTIEIMAGYGTSMPVIFKGSVTNTNEELDGADREIEIEAVDGFAETSETDVSLSYEAGTSAAQVLRDVANKLATPVQYSESAEEMLEKAKFGDEYVFIGQAADALTDICDISQLTWCIQHGILEIRKESEGMDTYVHLLNTSTGLINIPKRVYNSSVNSTDTDSTQDTLYGYEITYLMNGAIGVGDKVKVESNIVTGTFMVSDLQISGDNQSGDWTCTATIVEAGV